jgi:glycosyltransferase involved in cell wall biosynthesis
METLMGQLCRRMAARGHDVTVVTRSLPSAPRKETRDGVAIVRVPAPGGRFAFPIAAFPTVVRLARACDAIHTTTFSAAPLGSVASRIARKPVVLTVPELWIGKWRTFSDASIASATLFDLIERSIFAFPFDAYVGISKYTTERLRAYLGPKRAIRAIYCGFDSTPWTAPVDTIAIREKLGVASGDFFLVAYGRPGMSKGFRYLIDAFPEILRNVPNVRMRLILSDSHATARDLAELKRRADPRIVFERPLPFETLTEVVKSADCVVVPSLAEGFGYAALEASTAGVPLVVSETTSIPEVVGGRYQFATPRDPASIARAVEAIARGEYLERNVPRFDWDAAIDDYESVYETVVRTGAALAPT